MAYENCAWEVAEKIKGGTWQATGYRDVTVNGINYLLYGKADVLRGPDVFDIKWTRKYKTGKFFNKFQHPMYYSCFPKVEKFTYLISNGKEVFEEVYLREDTPNITDTIYEFQKWLENYNGFQDDYYTKWRAL